MSLLQALERHVPSAKDLLADVSPLKEEPIFWEDKGADFVCAYGVSASLYDQLRPWLDEDAKRRVVFIEDRPEALARLLEEDDAILLLNDCRVKLYFLETPLQIDWLAMKTAWAAVFLKLEMIDVSKSIYFEAFRKKAESTHLAAELLLSDAADWGCKAIRHARTNLAKPVRSALDLKFEGVAAIIVGAGPSLEKNGHLLKSLRDKALILAGGSAIGLLSFPPHFSAGIDKDEPLKNLPFPNVPFCFQARMHPDNFSKVKGDLLLAPDAHFSFLNGLTGEEDLFDAGWTVGNFMTALAVHWGCDPIVFVGMDYCYSGKKKYAQGTDVEAAGLIEALDSRGNGVLTQRDWLMAIQWMEEMAKKHPQRRFLNATEGGMGFLTPAKLEGLGLKEIPDLEKRVAAAIQKGPIRALEGRWAEWEQSLNRCREFCEQKLHRVENDLEGEIVYKQLLLPLWNIWRPVFERQLDLDPRKIAHQEKLRLNEILFYQQVVQEHLDVLR